MLRLRLCCIAVVVCAQALAQTGFSLRIPGTHRFHEGELIAMEGDFRAPKSPGMPYMFGGVLLDPAHGCGTLARPCVWRDGPRGVESGSPIFTDLNLYVPRLKPGRYRVALLEVGFQPRRQVVSNFVELEIVPASPAWVRRTVARSVATLKGSNSRNIEERRKWERAARQLRFLQQPLAWRASLDLLIENPGELLAGLREASDRNAACRLMQSRLVESAQLVTADYLFTMAALCGQQVLDGAADTLAAGLNAKAPEPRMFALEALARRALDVTYGTPGHATPAWLPRLRREIIASFPQLEYYRRSQFLGMYWEIVRDPAMRPLLEAILDRRPIDYSDVENWRLALRRLNELDPVRGRARLLAELRNPDTRLDTATLALLPASAVPPMDSALIQTLAGAQRNPGGNTPMAMTMIARYATPKALRRMKAIYESQSYLCQPELMAYFLRTDPAYAGRVFERLPSCAGRTLEVTPRLYMHPVLEKYLGRCLTGGDVYLREAAARALGRYGSPAAEGRLWDAFRAFHDAWKDRRAELATDFHAQQFEGELRAALTRGRNWLINRAGLYLVECLCVSPSCRQQTEHDLQAWNEPVRLEVMLDGGRDFQGGVAQYYGFESLAELEAKLAQFPQGTHFAVRVAGPGGEPAAKELARLAAIPLPR